jgi:hypothetical protein
MKIPLDFLTPWVIIKFSSKNRLCNQLRAETKRRLQGIKKRIRKKYKQMFELPKNLKEGMNLMLPEYSMKPFGEALAYVLNEKGMA